MTSEGTGGVSVQAATADCEVEKDSNPSPPEPSESASFTSDVVPQSGTTDADESFYSDALTSNGHHGDIAASPVISTLQIPPPGGSWSDILHTCGYDCYESPAKCPKRQAGGLDMTDRKHKYTKVDLGSGEIVRRGGYRPDRKEGRETKTRMDLGSNKIVETCGFGKPNGRERNTRAERGTERGSERGSERGTQRGSERGTQRGTERGSRHARAGSSNFNRRWTYTRYANDMFRGRSKKPTDDSALEFTVASYNVLAQNLLADHMNLYADCDATALDWQYRSKNLLKEIKQHQPDILCMQEVNAIHYDEFFEPELKQLGYDGAFKKRTGRLMDGCATFYKTHKFQLRHCEPVEYSTRTVSVLNRDNVALLLLLSPIVQPALSLCVGNTHLLFNPRRGDVKLAQLMVLLSRMDKLTYRGGATDSCAPPYHPSVLCGDFNSMPHSELYKLLDGGQLTYEGLITRTMSGQEESDPLNPYENRMVKSLLPPVMAIADQCRYIDDHDDRPYTQGQGFVSHRLNLQSVYRHVSRTGEKEVTTHHSLTNETVDYIFYSLAGSEAVPPEVADASGPMPSTEGPLRLMGSLQLMTEREMTDFGTMPNHALSSDHLLLMAKFMWDLKYCSQVK